MQRLRHLPLLCLLILALLTNPTIAAGFVWCVDADGHATLEAAFAGECDPGKRPPAAASSTPLPELSVADDCGPCLDLSPAAQWGSPRSRQADAPATFPPEPAPPAVSVYLPGADRLPPVQHITLPTPRAPAPILWQRTVVLLI